jgi:hypothetical protein
MKNILKRAGICHNLWQKTFCLAVLFITTWWKLYLDWVCLANRPEQTRIHSGISITSFLISSHHLSNSCVILIWNDSTFVTYVFFLLNYTNLFRFCIIKRPYKNVWTNLWFCFICFSILGELVFTSSCDLERIWILVRRIYCMIAWRVVEDEDKLLN